MNFHQARAKVEWAKEHLKNLERRISRLEDSYSAIIDVHPESGYRVIKYDLTDELAAQDISLIVGDTLHNLKGALDYGWIATLERHAPNSISEKTQFPAHETRKSLENALADPKKGFGSNLVTLILTKIKPYSGGNDALWAVKKLNILDKHRLLLPVITYTAIEGLEMENGCGEAEPCLVTPTMLQPPWYIPYPRGLARKGEGKAVHCNTLRQRDADGLSQRCVGAGDVFGNRRAGLGEA